MGLFPFTTTELARLRDVGASAGVWLITLIEPEGRWFVFGRLLGGGRSRGLPLLRS